jgi:integrase/recombinase XerD
VAKRTLSVVPVETTPGLRRAVDDFLAHQRAKGGSPRTLEYYEATLGKVFMPWALAAGLTEPEQLQQRDLDRFNASLLEQTSERTGKPLSKASVASYLRAVRGFLSWTRKEGLTADQLRVTPVKVPRKVLDTLSRAELNELEAAADSERDKLIVRVLGDAGLRLGELLALRPEHLVEDGRDRYLRIEGRSHGGGAKGDNGRLVPLSPAVFRRLKRYAEKGRPADAHTGRIFISLRRRPTGIYEPLDDRAVQQMLRAVAAKAGIAKPVNPHAFRHSMATNALRGGMNPLVLQKVLGHSDLSQISGTYSQLVASDTAREMYKLLAGDE